MAYFLFLDVVHPEIADAWSIDDESVRVHLEQFGKCGGVLALAVRFGNGRRLLVQVGMNGIEQRGFAHTRMPRKQVDAMLHQVFYQVHIIRIQGRNGDAFVADVLVDIHDVLLQFEGLLIVQILLVENDGDGDSIGLGSDQKPVDETGRSARHSHAHDEVRHVYIGSNDMALFREVHRLPNHIILAFEQGMDDALVLFAFKLEFNAVAHSQRVGSHYALQPERAFDGAVYHPTVVASNEV